MWALLSGNFPPGLSLDPATGIISGTPTASGSFSFSVSLTDSSAPTPTLAVRALTITIAVPLVITTTSLHDGVIGVAYSQTLAATDGNSTFTWSLASGILPGGLTISPTGVISGTPTTAGNSSFVVQVQDTGIPQQTKTQSLSIRIAAPLVTTITTLPPANSGVPYSQTLTATGGIAPLTWSLAPGSAPLPTGLNLSSAGQISGTPSAAGAFTFTVQLSDSSSPAQTAAKTFSITVTVAVNVSFYVQPANSKANKEIEPDVEVKVTDGSGKPEAGVKVTLSLAVNPGGAALLYNTSPTGYDGIASFDVVVTKPGVGYKLQATTNLAGAGTAISNAFTVK